jgi:hypothetical protein
MIFPGSTENIQRKERQWWINLARSLPSRVRAKPSIISVLGRALLPESKRNKLFELSLA